MFAYVGEHPLQAAAVAGASGSAGFGAAYYLGNLDPAYAAAAGAASALAALQLATYLDPDRDEDGKPLGSAPGAKTDKPSVTTISAADGTTTLDTSSDRTTQGGYVGTDPSRKPGFFGPRDHDDENAAYLAWMKDINNKTKMALYYSIVQKNHPKKS